MKQYTNELTAEMLAAFDRSPFTAEQLAKISTGTGNTSGDSAALVGSSLDNGDEIISSPQGSVRRAVRAGESLPENFLK